VGERSAGWGIVRRNLTPDTVSKTGRDGERRSKGNSAHDLERDTTQRRTSHMGRQRHQCGELPDRERVAIRERPQRLRQPQVIS